MSLPEPIPGSVPAIRAALRDWWAREARPLRFRDDPTPWGVLVVEVMAQQTRIDRVELTWPRFMERFPTPAALAAASPAEVLRAWAGMGYNRRAILLQRAARAIGEQHGGLLPRSVEELEALPGIGPYTARAVAAIAWGMPVAAVDTNVRRVVGRLVAAAGAPEDPGTPPRPAVLQGWADALVDPERPAAWTHAVMDLGATHCRPRQPRCAPCPLRPWCALPSSPAGEEGSRVPPARARPATTPFPETARWLRGRILEHLRALPGDAWGRIEAPLGVHDAAAVERALAALAAEGLLERGPDGGVRLPSTP